MMADFMARKLSVLVLEDIENDALLVVRQLNSHGLQFDWERVETAVEFEAALDRQSWDVIIADYDLPTIQAPDALAIATRRGIRTPIIVVSGIIGEETAVEVIKLGAVDYLLKDRLARLGAAVQHGIERERERAKTEQLELQLRNERETLEREQRFRALCDRAPVGIFFVDATGKWDYTNRYAKDKFNLSVDQNGEISWSEIVHPDDCEAVLSSWNSSQLGREEFRAEFRLASSHESERWVLAIATIEVSLDGQPGLLVGTLVDISSRKTAENAIQAAKSALELEVERRTEELSEALDRFKSIAEHLPDCIWQRVMREDGTSYVSYVSPGWEKIWGYSVDEIYRDADLWLKSVMPEDHSHAANLKPRAAITKTSQSSVFRIRSKQGDLRWVEDIAIPIFDERNRLVRYEGVARDITHRQSSRDELILRSQALASAKHGLVIVDAIQEDMPITYCNAAFEQMTGYTEEEVLGRNCRFLQGNDHEQPGLRRLRSAIRSGQSCSVTLRNYRNSGELFWNRLSIAPVKNERGELTHFVGAQEDVSHQVQLTKAKNQLADFHSLVLEISTQFISCGETEFKLILRRGLEAIGQLLAATRCFFVELSPDQSVLREAYEWCTEGSLPQFESLSGAATTDVPWISNQLMAACDPGGDQDPPTSDDDRTSFFEYGADSILCIPIQVDQSVRGILGVAEITNQQILDLDLYPLLTIVGDLFITARHRILAEENLSRHWALLEESQRIAHLGNWEWAPHNNQFVCSNELCRIFGHAPEEKPASVEIFLQCSNDDERLDLFASFDRVMATGEPIAIEHEIRDSTGRDRVLLTRCFRVTFKNGSPDVVRGTCQDITELRTEETKFRGLLDAAPDAMVIVDSRGTIQIANCQAEWMFGYSREELIGNPVEMLVPGQLRDVHRDHRAEFVNTPAVRPMGQEMELRGVRKDGSDLAVEISLSPFKTPSGVLTTAAVRDITARKEAERELQRSRERLDEAQKIAHIGYWDWDVQAGKTWWSDELYTICGVIKDSFQPTFPAFLDLVVEGDRPKLTAAWHDLLSGGEPFQLSYQLNTASGTRFHTFYAHSISDSSGTLLHLTGIVQDSTEQRIIENQLRLRERLVSVGTLAAGIAHEINNPLSAIMTAAVTARVVQSATQPNELVNECVDTITSAVVRTQKIVQNVLRLSRQESSEKEQANLNHIVTQASSLTKHFSDTHGANVLVDLEDDIPDLHLNTSEIEQVIVNLITNAVKSGDPAAVMIRTEKQGDRVKVIVSDNGCGIPESRLDRIFDPFYTSESALKGTGLGLTISHRIICDHGGEITVESVEGQGSTFTVELPVSDEKDA